MRAEIRVLGDVEVRVNGSPVDIRYARCRCVLAALVVESKRVVPTERLVDRVWGSRVPHRARQTLYGYVSRLRHMLVDADVTVSHRSGGYVLAVEPDQVDLHRFRALVGRARESPDECERRVLLASALAIWRGEAFGTVTSPWVAAYRQRLLEERLSVELESNDLRLQAGEHATLISDLLALSAAHQLDERVAGQLILALYRAGRQADALRFHRSIRDRLRRELGIDPGPDLTSLHQRILRAEPTSGVRPGPPGPRRCRPLPAGPPGLVGRRRETRHLLAPRSGCGRAGVVVTIDGMPGVGKTAMAVHLARRLHGRYPDHPLFVDLHGYSADPPSDPAPVLSSLLQMTGVPADQIPTTTEARAALWRSELAQRRVVLVLDNASDANQVRRLLPGVPGCLTLVTSRRRLPDLDVTQALSLDVLARSDAVALFRAFSGAPETDADDAAEVARLCGDLPLAVRLAAGKLRSRPAWTARQLVERLARGPLAELVAGHGSVVAAFDLSYRRLSPRQQQMFRALGARTHRDVDASEAATVLGGSVREAQRILDHLVDEHLVREDLPGRYRLHELLRQYARDVALGDDRRDAVGALIAGRSREERSARRSQPA